MKSMGNENNENNNNVECSEYDLFMFVMLYADDDDLGTDEREELLHHMNKCQPCLNCWREVNKIGVGYSKSTRRQELDFLALLHTKTWHLEFNTMLELAKGTKTLKQASFVHEEVDLGLALREILEATKRAEAETA